MKGRVEIDSLLRFLSEGMPKEGSTSKLNCWTSAATVSSKHDFERLSPMQFRGPRKSYKNYKLQYVNSYIKSKKLLVAARNMYIYIAVHVHIT